MTHNHDSDYSDIFVAVIIADRTITVQELSEKFFAAPKWMMSLKNIRNSLMRPLGLKVEKDLSELISFESSDVATISKKDKHLDFVIKLITGEGSNGKQRISVGTDVWFHNSFGRFYFTMIRPFHKIICKTLLNRAKKKLEYY